MLNRYCSLLTLFIISASPTPLLAASFNCEKAESTNEKLICDNYNISRLDEQHAKVYKLARKQSHNPAEVKAEAKAAWRLRETNCNTKKCLEFWYINRILKLQNIDGSQTTSPLDNTKGKPTLRNLYQGLRLETLGLKYLDTSADQYPSEVFSDQLVTFESAQSMVFDDDGIATRIELLGDNKIQLTRWGRGMREGTKKARQISLVYFDELNNDWRAANSYWAELPDNK